MKTFKIPVISGKDSLSSTYRGNDGNVITIPPVLCISVFGRIKNAAKTISADFKKVESTIVLVGKPDFSSMGGAVYQDVQDGNSSTIPHVDIKGLPKTFQTLHHAVMTGEVLSAHDVSEGGIITTLFEMCVGGDMGATIDVLPFHQREDLTLFNETAGCFLVEVSDEKTARRLFKNVPYRIIGKTTQKKYLQVTKGEKDLFTAAINDLKKAWQTPMRKLFP